jgi:hypothetical protein
MGGRRILTLYSSQLEEDLAYALQHDVQGLQCTWQDLPDIFLHRFEALSVWNDEGHDADLELVSSMKWLKLLNIGPRPARIDLSGLEELEYLGLTMATGCRLPLSLSRLRTMQLWRYSSKAKDLREFVAPLLECLVLTQGNTRSLAGLESARERLVELQLRHLYKLEDVEPLRDLLVLHKLEISCCKRVRDLSALSRSTALQELKILDCGEIRSLDFLRTLRGVRSVILIGTEVEDGDLSMCEGLEHVYFDARPHYSHVIVDGQLHPR